MKINLWWLIAIVILAIVIGGFIGYGIYMSNNDKKDIINTTTDQLQDLLEKNTDKTKEENKVDNTTIVKQTSKYDEEKTIIVNGKNYKVGTINEIIGQELNVKIYLNDKLIKTYNNLFYDIEGIDRNNLNDRIKLKSVLGADNKEYIVIVYDIVETIDDTKQLMICNQEEQIIGILQARGFNEGINVLNEEHDSNYKINEDSINIYIGDINDGYFEGTGSIDYGAAKLKIVIREDCLITSIEKLYVDGEEVIRSGK